MSAFYITGGTVPLGTPSYVERQADRDLYEGLARGEFCYVLHARQMGKSSLMAHTTARLREAGIAVVNLDLTRLGQNLTVEQWYDGLLGHIGRQLDLEDELEEYWLTHERLSPLQRWLGALHDVVLSRVAGRLVIAVDEIDAVRSLPFSTDEFFAAIRDCYNRRSQDPEFARLTFCLLGVATPSDLIQDTRTTPFNIGQRIELSDFSAAEAQPLTQGLGRDSRTSEALLARVLGWTGGHPYLTQRLCQALAQAGDPPSQLPHSRAEVDRLCADLFLSPSAREKDDNLLFVREQLLRNEGERAALLDRYAQVWAGKRVAVEETNSLVDRLRLSGVVRTVQGRLAVRNRIYAQVFDRQWVIAHMPDAEIRRQQAAYRRGLLRASTVSAVIFAVVTGLSLAAVTQARRAERQRRVANQQRRLAQEGQHTLRHVLYAAQVKLAQQSWEEGNLGPARALLDAWRPKPGEEDLRGFEWRYLWPLCQGDQLYTFKGSSGLGHGAAFSPDGKILASSGNPGVAGAIRLWDVRTKRVLASLHGHTAVVNKVVFSPDGRLLASASDDHTLKLWDVASRRELATLKGHRDEVWGVSFSPDGRTLASASSDTTVRLWDVATRRLRATLTGHTAAVCQAVFSPDGKLLATGSVDRTVKLWRLPRGMPIATLTGHTDGVISVAISPDGKTLASGAEDSTIRLWDLARRRELATLRGHQGNLKSVVFSPDGQTLASAGVDNIIRLWNVGARQEVAALRGHANTVWCVAFSPDGKLLASDSADMTLRLWPVRSKAFGMVNLRSVVTALAFTPDGKTLATGDDEGRVKLWKHEPGDPGGSLRAITTLRGRPGTRIYQLAFSSDGRMLAAAAAWNSLFRPVEARLWEVASGRTIATFTGTRAAPPWFAFSPVGNSLAVSCDTDRVELWDLAQRRSTARVKNMRGMVFGLAFSPDGRLLAVGNDDSAVDLWEVAGYPPKVGGRAIGHFEGYTGGSLAFAPDGRLLVSTDWGQTRLWDVATQRTSSFFKEPTGVSSSAFSPDGKTLAIPNASSIPLWNLPVRREAITLKGHTGPVNAAAFSPDGNTLASASGDGTVRLWQAASFAETDLPRVTALGGDRAVTLQWEPVAGAAGYHVFRGRFGAPVSQFVRLTARPVAATAYTDRSPSLVNGQPQTYGVAAVYPNSGRKLTLGSPTTLAATPVAAPAGFLGCSIGEAPWTGSVAFQPPAEPPAGTEAQRRQERSQRSLRPGQILIRGAGDDIAAEADRFYFASQPIAGDFTISVRALSLPTRTDEFAKAGLMVREAREETARCTFLGITPDYGLQYQTRSRTGDYTLYKTALRKADLKLPIILRLRRRGASIIAEYSRDEGRSFQTAGRPTPFDPPLPPRVYAGLAITSHDQSQLSEATFDRLSIELK